MARSAVSVHGRAELAAGIARQSAVAGRRAGADLEDRAIDDLSDIARTLGVPCRSLREAIGSPWHRARHVRYDLDLGQLFVGRDGPSVAIWCLGSDDELMGARGLVTHTTGFVVVGTAAGTRLASGDLRWTLGGTKVRLERGGDLTHRGFLTGLKTAVVRAAAEKAPELSACRGCQEVVGPESRYDEHLCHACAAGVMGVRN